MTSIFDGLNPQQRKAVEQTEGPVMVIAGAGSGKTRVITTRIVHLLEKGVNPFQILAMTFTNKAAREMKERVHHMLEWEHSRLTVTTFHSFCARFLRQEIAWLERDGNFAIFDSQDQLSCIKRVVKSFGFTEKDVPASPLRNKFSYYKNTQGYNVHFDSHHEQELFDAYQTEMRIQNALDFDDLLNFTCNILENSQEVRERYQERYRYMMVDEYQDTNRAQFKLVKLLVNKDLNICVVGDEDQSIYGWRGADITNILEFEKTFKGTKVFKLEQNYRSTQNILNMANAVISINKQRKPKKLWTEAGEGEPVIVKTLMSGLSEAEHIVQKIASLSRSEKTGYSEFAILFRSNYLSRALEEMFRRYRIPYQLIGGLKFYDRKEIKDVLSYMRIVVNPNDWTSFTRAIATPSRGIGAKSLEALHGIFRQGNPIKEMLETAIKEKALGKKGLLGLKGFLKLYETLDQNRREMPPSAWLAHLIELLDYRQILQKQDEFTADDREANLDELLLAARELEKMGATTLEAFMDYSALISDQDELEGDEEKVTLMTVHAAKGLEFDFVFVMGLEENVFPNARSINEGSDDALEEERRLFYVAVTRARKLLTLTCARKRQSYGTSFMNPPSQFLMEVNPSFQKKVRNQETNPLFGGGDNQLRRMESILRKKNVVVDFSSSKKRS